MSKTHTPIRKKYEDEVKSALASEFGIKNPMAIPRITKIIINMGTGQDLRDKALSARLIADMSTITAQMPKVQKARLSVAGFGIREGHPVGLTSTLRGDRMYSFFDRLVSATLPRLRDFRGLSRSKFDKQGNYSFGIKEYTVFPEIDLAKVSKSKGLEITLVTSTDDREQAERLLELMGMPFEKEENK